MSLALAPVPAFQRATLSGVLVVPAGWRHDGVALTASLLGVQLTDPPFQREVQVEAVETHASFETYAWHLDDVQTGAYAISCENPPVVFQVGLHPGGTSGVRMEMGAPTDLRVRVLDSLTHANVDVQAVQWNRVAPADETSTRSGARLQALGAGVYLGQCTIGEIDVSALSLDFESYERGTRRIVTHAGTNEVTLLLTKNTRIALTFRDGQTPLVDQPASVDMRQVDGDGRVMGWSRRNTSPTWKAMVDKPGRYRIRLLEPPPGFLMPAEQVVDIERGTLTDVVIQLTRKP
ncbi:MAG: hypothetical protein JNL28_01170 [Planctomycetes bacterium]|nr:hypothetical protein [Planctomycetota bacterium]